MFIDPAQQRKFKDDLAVLLAKIMSIGELNVIKYVSVALAPSEKVGLKFVLCAILQDTTSDSYLAVKMYGNTNYVHRRVKELTDLASGAYEKFERHGSYSDALHECQRWERSGIKSGYQGAPGISDLLFDPDNAIPTMSARGPASSGSVSGIPTMPAGGGVAAQKEVSVNEVGWGGDW